MTARRMGRTGAVRTGVVRTGVVGLVAAATAATAFTAPAQAGPTGPAGIPADHRAARFDHQAAQRAMDTVVRAGIPGVTGQTRDGDRVWKGTSGVGDRGTGVPRGKNDRFRIASITKTFVATALLQLEAEGRLDLDDTVDRWLPGLVRGNGNDGRRMTVRQLLNHTSGVPDYLDDAGYQKKYVFAPGFLRHRYDTRTPQAAVAVALRHKPAFEPGAKHSYSNTGYVLAALIIEKASGNSYEHEIRERIIKPLGLRATTLPGNSSLMPRPSSRAYSKLSHDQTATRIYDVTLQNASQSWADGDMISSAGDLNRFFSALMRGKLLSKKQLAAMKTTVPDPSAPVPGAGYGLGIATYKTACGTKVWGHTGGWLGTLSEAVVTEDGRRSVAVNLNGDWAWPVSVANAAFCGDGTTTRGPDVSSPAGTSLVGTSPAEYERPRQRGTARSTE
ncbi:serine hydrolase domain-containing protein [Streptomyces sp. NPDC055078]